MPNEEGTQLHLRLSSSDLFSLRLSSSPALPRSRHLPSQLVKVIEKILYYVDGARTGYCAQSTAHILLPRAFTQFVLGYISSTHEYACSATEPSAFLGRPVATQVVECLAHWPNAPAFALSSLCREA